MTSFGERFLWNFYIVDRNTTTFEHKDEVPNFTPQILPIYFTVIILEHIVYYIKTGKFFLLNDGIISLSHGMLMETGKLLTNGIELIGYEWIYQMRLFDLDWESPWTWWSAAVLIDFCFYWVHRAVHEVGFLWASHQVHHSSDEYNYTTALRQPAFQHLFTIGFYQPLALLGIPLPAMLVHMQFNLFVQFWVHTELIPDLGPIGWIFNTASHHRVHHGRNKWCLDKNYGGFLIIWDRIFGTFEPERKNEKIHYGLVSQPQSLEPFYLELFYYRDVIAKTLSMKTWGDKLRALFHGPGWNPGTPRLGDMNALPEETVYREKYNPQIAVWIQVYLFLHFAIVIVVQQMITIHYATMNFISAFTFIFFLFFSFFTIGSAFDKKWWVPLLEVLRCFLTLTIMKRKSFTQNPVADSIIAAYFVLSSVIWTFQSLAILVNGKKKIA